MSAFFGNIMIAVIPSISKTSTAANANSATNDIEAIAKGGRGNYYYTWNKSGTEATVSKKSDSVVNIVGALSLGKTTAYCTIYDIITGNTVLTPPVEVDWTSIPLTATTNSATKTYNGSSQLVLVLDGINGTYSGIASASGINVGSYTTTITGANSYTGSVTGTLTIGKATLIITTSNASMTYGSSIPTSSFGYSLSGLLGTDTANVVTGLNGISVGSATHSTTGTSTSSVGSYPISTNVSGLSATNYNFTAINGTLTIGKAALTITTSNASMTYGSSLPTFTYTPTGFVNSDTATVITGTVTHSTTGSSSANAGTYAVTPVVSGLSATNYSFTPANGSLTIEKAALTIATNNVSMTYGSSLPSFTYTSTGFVNSDTATVITGTVTHSTTGKPTASVGTYPVTPVVSGLSATNYSFTAANGTLTITAATLNLTAAVTSFTYNGTSQSLSYSVTGAGVDTGYSVSGTTASTNAGSYTATLTKSSTNYILGTSSLNWSIGKAALTITTNNASMTYGSSLPVFSYTPTGFVNSETATVITGTVTHSTTGSSSANAGTYAITPIVSGLSATNYTFTPANGTLTINAATLTALTTTGSATYSGSSQTVTVISGINGTYSGSTSVSGTNAGPYSTTITGTGNYSGSVTGTLTINAATLTAATREGGATFNGDSQTVTVISGINGTYSGSTTASGTNAGTYSTTITGTGNYTGSVGGTLTISPATIALYAPLGYTGVPSLPYNGSTQFMSGTVSGTARNNYSYTISSTSGINPGIYTSTIVSTTTNYVVSAIYNSFIWYITTPLTAASKTSSVTYNGSPQSFTITGINGSYTGSPTVSGTVVESYTTTIYGSSFYTGSVTGTLTINAAALSASSTSSYVTYNRGQQSFSISGINAPSGSYYGSTTVYGTSVGTYTTRIFGTGNYSGYVDGTLNIRTDSGYIDIFYGGVYDSSYTTGFYVPVRTSNAAFSVTHSISGPGAADAQHTSSGRSGPYDWAQEANPAGAYVRNTNPQTAGWVLTITATITDPNYSVMIAETTVTFTGYVAPPPSGTGYGGGGGLIAE